MIVIMGMHRSGTSLVGQLLADAGIDIVNTMISDKNNEAGYYEDMDVMVKNDRILSFNGGTWHSPPDVMNGKYEFDNECEAVKDPRFCLTYPAWDFGDHKIIKVYRKKESVIKSLLRRHPEWTRDRAERLRNAYITRMKRYNGVPTLEVHYEKLLKGKLKKLGKFIGKELNPDVIKKDLNHGV